MKARERVPLRLVERVEPEEDDRGALEIGTLAAMASATSAGTLPVRTSSWTRATSRGAASISAILIEPSDLPFTRRA